MTETVPTEPDVVDILTRDHQDMVELIAQIEGASDAATRRDLADTVIAEVMRHAVAEVRLSRHREARSERHGGGRA